MKVENMTSSSGHKVANQFIITDGNPSGVEIFQSYDSVIVRKTWEAGSWHVELDRHMWDCSTTTGKYRNLFLGEKKAETQKKIDNGEYILTDLN